MSTLDMTKSKMFGMSLLIFATVFLLMAPLAFSQYSIFSGYGYGYGDCSGDEPTKLKSRVLLKKKRLLFSWKKVTFTNCEDEDADSYQLQVRRKDGKIVLFIKNIQKNRRLVKLTSLKPNRSHRFRVRAVAVDDAKTDWSSYKTFRTPPRPPHKITITHQDPSSVSASWRNVLRSKKLRFYLVTVKQGKTEVFSEKVRKGLKKERAEVLVTGLEPNTTYVITVRSVFSKRYKSGVVKRTFTTTAE